MPKKAKPATSEIPAAPDAYDLNTCKASSAGHMYFGDISQISKAGTLSLSYIRDSRGNLFFVISFGKPSKQAALAILDVTVTGSVPSPGAAVAAQEKSPAAIVYL